MGSGQLGFDATIADDVDSNGKRKAMDYANEKRWKKKEEERTTVQSIARCVLHCILFINKTLLISFTFDHIS